MAKQNKPKAEPSQDNWSPEDVAFAAAELTREFPYVASERVASAVESAVAEVPAGEGRVKLLQSARRLLRSR